MKAPAPSTWYALGAAMRADLRRVPFIVGDLVVGAVAANELAALASFDELQVQDDGVVLAVAPEERDAALARVNGALRDAGRLRGWRDELFPLYDPATLTVLAHFERAAARYWGTLTLGAHATGWVAGPDGRPAALWVAQRSFTKSTDPGLHDNLIGGGVPIGQTPEETLVREAWEEAGLTPALMAARRPGRVLRTARDIPEGLQHELIHGWDLELPAGVVPCNQDGEVHAFRLLDVEAALALAATAAMTVDAALVTLDFAVRHGLVDDEATLARLQPLVVGLSG
ncbi:NUDIX hydrolase [Rubrivivax benzoatilyticus]|uniref:DUF4743 domain-containing protein n=1 Tax=Rubrivivax benzoatilyticus TaxID=316997 RepID=A0ABX0I010_9BURK|nr:DUF4743 domain-containing protein [Rubrivivax benzoatilyticus]MCD0422874.1 DUF4743 domain-containing protein [Rubrivivax sp. JA1024]NHK98949.1 DUF4743 domain-containing protein [Rubrivivax benzoatilyticus]NHL24452.1 DUF4743 domain-containing protein [Rubrivivax benzoatilyticus]